MKLTETKLKQMILEALKNSSFRSFGIPTPDEKLRSQIGDANFDKIQSLASNPDYADQASMLKQGLDDTYPSELEQEKINDILEPLGFTEFKPGFMDDHKSIHKVFDLGEYGSTRYDVRFSFRIASGTHATTDFEDFKRHRKSIRYDIRIEKKNPTFFGQPLDIEELLRKSEYMKTPNMFTVDLTNKQEREQIETLIIKKEKAAILKALEELT
tara:strand:- start:161 stop:799 length:639 start_codon:yes stop_codon:yes gene_type:complete